MKEKGKIKREKETDERWQKYTRHDVLDMFKMLTIIIWDSTIV